MQNMHEQAYLLAKGRPALPARPIEDTREWHYTGNRLHPTQKSIKVLRPIIEAFCPADGLVLDPFCGSGSALVASQLSKRDYLGIELECKYCEIARLRVACNEMRVV